jgi:integrase
MRAAQPEQAIGLGCSGTSTPAQAYVGAQRTEQSKKSVRYRLDRIARFLSNGLQDADSYNWSRIRYSDARRISNHLISSSSASNTHAHLVAIRGMVRELWANHKLAYEEMKRILCIKSPPQRTVVQEEEETVSHETLMKVIAACGVTKRGLRDAALLAVLGGAGLRRSEAVHLAVSDYHGGSTILVRHGKRDNDRWAVIVPELQPHLLRWWKMREGGTVLFPPIDKAGRVVEGFMHPNSLADMMKMMCKRAGVPTIRPHDLRRSLATALIDGGVDIFAVQQILGHKSSVTTQRYDMRGAKKKRAEVARFTFKGGAA